MKEKKSELIKQPLLPLIKQQSDKSLPFFTKQAYNKTKIAQHRNQLQSQFSQNQKNKITNNISSAKILLKNISILNRQNKDRELQSFLYSENDHKNIFRKELKSNKGQKVDNDNVEKVIQSQAQDHLGNNQILNNLCVESLAQTLQQVEPFQQLFYEELINFHEDHLRNGVVIKKIIIEEE